MYYIMESFVSDLHLTFAGKKYTKSVDTRSLVVDGKVNYALNE